VGPWLGPGKVNGIVLALEGHAKPYVILRNDQACSYPAGLTQVGDWVSMRVRPAPEFYTVHLSEFRNHVLEEAMPRIAQDLPPLHPHGVDERPLPAVQTVRRLTLVQNPDSQTS
jgi:hypothetical protein